MAWCYCKLCFTCQWHTNNEVWFTLQCLSGNKWHFMPESKQQSMVWKYWVCLWGEKNCSMPSIRKVMLIVFWYCCRRLLWISYHKVQPSMPAIIVSYHHICRLLSGKNAMGFSMSTMQSSSMTMWGYIWQSELPMNSSHFPGRVWISPSVISMFSVYWSSW